MLYPLQGVRSTYLPVIIFPHDYISGAFQSNVRDPFVSDYYLSFFSSRVVFDLLFEMESLQNNYNNNAGD